MRLNLNKIRAFGLAATMMTLMVALVACSEDESPSESSDRVEVVVSMYPLEYFTERIGGDRVQVRSIVPPGADAHDFEPTPGDLRTLADADLLVFNGLGLEPWVDAVLDAGDAPDSVVQAAAESIALRFEDEHIGEAEGHDEEETGEHADEDGHDEEEADEHGHADGDLDPHIWLDPQRASGQVRAIQNGLTKIDPEGTDLYRRNADALSDDLMSLDRRYTEALSDCEFHTFVTSHDSFNYLAARYGLAAVGVTGINPEAEPSPRALAELSDAIEEAGISHLLVSPIDTERLTDTVARETGARTLPLHTVQNLTENEKGSGETFLTLMDANLESLVTALGCKP